MGCQRVEDSSNDDVYKSHGIIQQELQMHGKQLHWNLLGTQQLHMNVIITQQLQYE